MHEREQADRPQRDGLAAGVRAGDDERRVAVADPDVDRHDPPGQARMPRAEQDDLLAIDGLRPDAVHLGRERSFRGPEVEPGSASSVSRSASPLAATRADSSSRIRSTSSCLGDLRLAPGVAELDRDERLDEERLAAARGVVDDALDARTGLGLDRHDVATVAERDDRLLEGRAQLRPDEGIEAPLGADRTRREPPPGGRRGGATRCRAARRPDRSFGRASSEPPAAPGSRGQSRGAAAGDRRRATSGGGLLRRACRRARGTGRDRAGRPGRRARSRARCRGRPRCRRRDARSAAPGSGPSRRGRDRR